MKVGGELVIVIHGALKPIGVELFASISRGHGGSLVNPGRG